MAADAWRGIWVKVERAKEHVRDLERRVDEFMSRKPFTAVVARAPNSNHCVITALATEQPPMWWGAIASDAVTNLRAALDLTVSQLILHNGGKPGHETGFPLADTPAEFEEIRSVRLRGVDPATSAAIDRLRPYRGASPQLWRLLLLDEASKRFGLLPIAAATKSLIDVTSNLDFPNTPITISPGYPYKAVYPVETGTELARVSRAHAAAELRVNAQGAFFIALGEPEAMRGEALLPTLRGLVRASESTIQPLIRPLISV